MKTEMRDLTMVRTYTRRKPVEAMKFDRDSELLMDDIVRWLNRGRERARAWHNCTDIFVTDHEGDTLYSFVGSVIVLEGNELMVLTEKDFEELYLPMPDSPDVEPRPVYEEQV